MLIVDNVVFESMQVLDILVLFAACAAQRSALPLRARARAVHAREETTIKYRRFQIWANGRRQREDGRGLGVPGGGAALEKIICLFFHHR